ncbi:mechanosensitive ion channel family protein [Robertmurraya korlensis]|uniref:mechanosensitive ion channel family protein n=1 Tax=Robertmurraya korlensis TaxID=519977 RepID=UPI002041985A|nr:mechanosensitive ion channel family protein [Robertmurraya korlensis]MCM3603088.1 mechanosensitive ion channel family protein [Robertmurraya korlensis]
MKYWEKIINDLKEKAMNEDLWLSLGEGALKIIAIFILSGIFIKVGKVMIENVFKVRTRSPLRVSERREATLLKLLQNILTYVVYFIAFMMILSTLTIDVSAMLAGAGIVGLAVGFGAQNLVRDIITGFFIIFEDQFSVGDFVRIGQFEGTVEEIGLRTTKIKTWTGELHILPNGNITEVTNFSLYNSMAVVDLSISYESDIKKAEAVISELLHEMPAKYEDIVKTPEILGVQNLAASDVVLRIAAETLPMKHFLVARLLRKELKECLDRNGIEIPYPRMIMYSRQDKVTSKKALGNE